MKPINLKMSGFIPFGGVVEVPFDKLGNSGLFLITGKTGAGKTSIFDGISFALFGETSGAYREIKSVRSDFASPSHKTFVEFVFSHKNSIYKVHRVPSYMRQKLKGDGLTQEVGDANIYRDDELVESGMDRTNEYVRNLLGINYKQFKQIAMIAQGEFLNLLFADSKERIEIFRNIFNTNIYESFQKDIKELALKSKRELDEININLSQYLNDLSTEQEQSSGNVIYKSENILENTKIFVEAEEENIINLNNKRQEDLKVIDDLTAKISSAEIENDLIRNRNLNEEKLQTLLTQKDDKEKQKLVFESKKVAFNRILPLENIYNKNIKNLEEKEIEISNSKIKIEQLTNEIAEQNKEQSKIKDLGNEVEQNKIDLDKLYSISQIFQNKINLENNERLILDAKQRLENEKNVVEQEVKRLEIANEENQNKIQTLPNIENKILVENQKKIDIEKVLIEYDNLYKRLQAVQSDNLEIETLRGKYQAKENDCKKEIATLNNMEIIFLKSQAGIFADNLQDNEPCLVCGSIHHPNKATKLDNAPTKNDLDIKKKQIEKLKNELEIIKNDGTMLKGRIETINKQNAETLQALNVSFENLETEWQKNRVEIEKVAEILRNLNSEKISIENLRNSTQSILNNIEMNNQKLQDIKFRVDKNIEDENILKGQLQNINEQVKGFETLDKVLEKIEILKRSIFENSTIIENFENGLRIKSEELNKINGGFIELENQKDVYFNELEKSKNIFENEIKNCGFGEVVTYKNILPQSSFELENEENELQIYFKEFERITASLEESKNLIGKNLVDVEVLKESKNQKGNEIKLIEIEIQEKNTKLSMTKKSLENAEALYVKQKQKEREYTPILEISQTANGELSGKDKIAFETFVQGFYFENVLIGANERFKEMTNNRYKLLKSRDAMNKKAQAGLELEVLDNFTGEIRNIKSLSGGESFKASLSLALGLSDMIQSFKGGIEIDVMLIDEGFGSLDDESLIQAINILHNLSLNNRLVGIISHISEVKESIDKKIIVEKSDSGSTIYMELN